MWPVLAPVRPYYIPYGLVYAPTRGFYLMDQFSGVVASGISQQVENGKVDWIGKIDTFPQQKRVFTQSLNQQ